MNVHQILVFVDLGLCSTCFILFSCLRSWKEIPPEAQWDGKNCPLQILSTGYRQMLGLLCSKVQQLGTISAREKSVSWVHNKALGINLNVSRIHPSIEL